MKTVGWGLFYLSVATLLGAFGTHALKDSLTAQAMATYQTAHEYQVMSAIAIIALGLSQGLWPQIRLTRSISIQFVGSVVFSGSLYALSLSGVRVWGAVTPVGGTLIIGSLIWASWQIVRQKSTAT